MDFFPERRLPLDGGGNGFDDPLIQQRVGCCAREEGGPSFMRRTFWRLH